MWLHTDRLIQALQKEPWATKVSEDSAFWHLLLAWMEQHAIAEFLDQVTQKVDEIVDIDPDLAEPQILARATRHMVAFLQAHHASVRIYDPRTEQMLSYGSFPSEESNRETFISLEGSVAGEVVRTRLPYLVPDILQEERYRNKAVVLRKGVNSLMAVPLEIPRFFPHERDIVGVIQIYFSERQRVFTPLEIKVVDLMARRLSFVMARKKILSMHRADEKREAIVGHLFRTMGTRGGIKLEEVFERVVPEVADMVDLQSSALFSVTRDLKRVVLEAGYPAQGGYHSIGKGFPVNSEPVFELLLNLRDYAGTGDWEVVTPAYVLVVDPQRSDLISANLKRFAAVHNINSILYIPLRVNDEVRHFMTFDALDQRKRYREEEIDTLLFLGHELMKAQKMERLDDALHDFKNPAIAIAGFARRLKALLDKKDDPKSAEQIRHYADILLAETGRLQELALSLYDVGEEQVLDLSEVLRRRFDINREAIREQFKSNIDLREGPFSPELLVQGHSIHLERVFDNLLHNATKAIPLKGGMLIVRTYAEGEWVCAEITNTGQLSEEDRLKIVEGEGEGRGLYITQRLIRLLRGKVEIHAGKETTTFVVRLPRCADLSGDSSRSD